MRHWVKTCFLCALFSAGLVACTSVEFAGTENRLDLLARDVTQGDFAGTVVWGGKVLEIANLESGTELLILALPLNSGNVPQIDEPSVGRFVATHSGYLEPEDFAPGRYVTLAGNLAGLTDAWSHEGQPFDLPLVRSSQVHLWPRDPSTWQTRYTIGLAIGIHN